MEKIKIFIVEDEFFIAQDISIRLQKLGYQVIGVADSAENALRELKNQKPDICIVDIKLKGEIDGITLAHQINNSYQLPLIFLTSFKDDLAIRRAKEAKPAAYMFKPFNDQELQIAIDLAITNFSKINSQNVLGKEEENKNSKLFFLNESIFVRKKHKFYRVNYDDILWIAAQSNYSIIVTQKEKYTLAVTLGQIVKKLSMPYFARVSRSYFINLNKIDSIEGNSIFINGQMIAVSKSNRAIVFQHFNIL